MREMEEESQAAAHTRKAKATENEDGREGEKGRVEEKTRFIVEGPARNASKERKHGQKRNSAQAPSVRAEQQARSAGVHKRTETRITW